ncbi:hypothetical protein [Rhizobium glycinendophyticum]|uniref:Uncharacterized protein n=1 Tax=Rhizobium glycinendophyticum TaxID=2589807 RepID=A0A504UGV9_9HYPH|nr:hypothetical protein [Rhizobium glycinendophyticum]TPP10035.1 hypothetical protein FJQ55_03950 [Rhizobium glycinendophyticum]
MGNRHLTIAMLALCSWTMPAFAAADRIYCAASDAAVNVTLETGFSNKDEQRLIHFRGMVAVMEKAVPPEFRRIELDSDMLRQYWTDGRDLRFSLHAFSPTKSPVYRVTISLVTNRKTDSDPRYDGNFRLAVQKLTSGSRVDGDSLFEHDVPIFCAIKRPVWPSQNL